jgi:hypothetical protein
MIVAMIALGCGHCDGALRAMGEGYTQDEDTSSVAPEVVFGLWGDGPGSRSSEELLSDAGITTETWFLLDGAGEVVPSTLRGDWGGHTCLNGNSFELVPDEPLSAGEYTLVLRIEAIGWDWIGSEEHLTQFEGEQAIVQPFVVSGTVEG